VRVAERRIEQVMGTVVSAELHDPVATHALDAAFAWLRQVDAVFSPYRIDSEIARLERGAPAQPVVREVLEQCEALRAATDGYFDVRATGRLDPSGFVKGWAVDRAARLLERAGAQRFWLNAGGDVLLRGGAPWRVGIQHPKRRDRVACVVEVVDGAVATSGAYERGAHIVDPHTRRTPDRVLSVTVVGPRLGLADAYATAAFAMGADGPAWTATLDGYDAMTILDDERVLSTRGFLDRCPGGAVAASLVAAC
jgi:thiamine biosynthesis lipoprotein